MKSLNQYITEKLKVSKKQYNYCPKTREELKDLLNQLLEERGCEANLNDIDVSNITDMSGLFWWTSFNGDISGWDVSNVTNMREMFRNCEKLDCDLSNWDVSNVKDMHAMFAVCINFEGKGLENWDVSNVTNMDSMFCRCSNFKGKGLENWNVSNVTNMQLMFYNCKKFNTDISKWDVSKVKHIYEIFGGCPINYKYKPKFK